MVAIPGLAVVAVVLAYMVWVPMVRLERTTAGKVVVAGAVVNQEPMLFLETRVLVATAGLLAAVVVAVDRQLRPNIFSGPEMVEMAQSALSGPAKLDSFLQLM